MTAQELVPRVVSVSWANDTKGKAKSYPYYQPIVFGIRKTKDGRQVYRPIDRPLHSRRSLKLAMNDAKELAEYLKVPFVHKFGSLTDKEVSVY
jgi:hypothetical protein